MGNYYLYQSPCQNESFVNTSRKLLENSNETFPVMRYFTWKLELVSDILRAIVVCNFTKKETLAQVFSCEFCEISKNTFYYRTPLVAASGQSVWLKTVDYFSDKTLP